jgi:transposase
MLLQAFYSIRSERQLMGRMEFDLLFRWFAGLGLSEQPSDAQCKASHLTDRDGHMALRIVCQTPRRSGCSGNG